LEVWRGRAAQPGSILKQAATIGFSWVPSGFFNGTEHLQGFLLIRTAKKKWKKRKWQNGPIAKESEKAGESESDFQPAIKNTRKKSKKKDETCFL